MIKNEYTILLRNRKLLFICVGAILINIFLWGRTIYDIESDSYQKAKNLILEKNGGELNQEKESYINEYYAKLVDDYGSGKLDKQWNPYYYGEYEFIDYNVLTQLKERMEIVQSYSSLLNEKVSELDQIHDFYAENGNLVKAAKIEKVKSQIQLRELAYLQNDSIILEWISYSYSAILELLVALIISSISAQNRKYKSVEFATTKGRRWNGMTQNVAVLSMEFVVCTMIEFVSIIPMFLLRDVHFLEPLYYVEGYEYTLFDGSVLEFVLIVCVLRIVAIVLIGDIFYWIAYWLEQDTMVIIINILLLGICYFNIPMESQNQYNPINPLNVLGISHLWADCKDIYWVENVLKMMVLMLVVDIGCKGLGCLRKKYVSNRV